MENTINEIVFSDDNSIIKNAIGEVTNSQDIWLRAKKPRFNRGGLYDPYIFGLAERCKCGLVVSGKCPRCGFTVYDEDTYNENYAYYQLHNAFIVNFKLTDLLKKMRTIGLNIPFIKKNMDPLVNLWSLSFDITSSAEEKLVESIFGTENKDDTEDEITTERLFKIQKDGKDYKLSIHEIDEYSDIHSIGANGLMELSNYSFDGYELSFIRENVNSILPIKSVGLRQPKLPVINGKVRKHFPDVHFEYKAIISMDKYIESVLNNLKISTVDKATCLYLMNKLYDLHILKSKMFQKSKKSTFRSNISSHLGSSMRWNAISYNKAKLNEIFIPRSGAYHALQSQIIQKIVNEHSHLEYDAFKLYESEDPLAVKIMEEIVSKSQYLFNRNPTLHRNNFMQFKPRLWDDDTPAFGVNPYICKSYNLDFDGDQCAGYFVTDDNQIALLGDSMKAENIWIFDKTHEPSYLPSSTTMYGLYCATKIVKVPEDQMKKFDSFESMEKAYKDIKLEHDDQCILLPNKVTTYGREKLTHILDVPIENFIDLNPLTMKEMITIISGLQDHPDRIRIINEIRDFGNEIATIVGIDHLPLQDLYKDISPKVQEIVNDKEISDTIKVNKIMKMIPEELKHVLENLPDTNIDVLLKGSRINPATLQSLYTPYVRFGENNEVKVGDSTVIEGLSEEEYINTAHSQRTILEVKARSVPREGFNRSQLALVGMKLKYSNTDTDCQDYNYVPEDLVKKHGMHVAESAPKSKYSGFVPVLTPAFSKEDTIYRNQVCEKSSSINPHNSRIGINYADALTETFYQAELGLKYGGLLNNFSGDDIIAVNSGTPVLSEDGKRITVGDYTYILGKNIVPGEKVVKHQKIEVGDTVAINANLVNVELRYKSFYSIFDFQVAGESRKGEKKFSDKKGVSYAPISGKIQYKDGYVYIDGKLISPIYDGYTYFYPDGWIVNYADRICSITLSLAQLLKVCDKEYAVYIFWKELSRIAKFDWNPDLVEIMFKILTQSSFSVKTKILAEKDFVSRQIYGATGKGFTKALKAGFDKKEMKTSIKLNDENPILKLMMRSSTELNSTPDWEFIPDEEE